MTVLATRQAHQAAGRISLRLERERRRADVPATSRIPDAVFEILEGRRALLDELMVGRLALPGPASARIFLEAPDIAHVMPFDLAAPASWTPEAFQPRIVYAVLYPAEAYAALGDDPTFR